MTALKANVHTARAVKSFRQAILSDASKINRRYQDCPRSKRNERHTLEGRNQRDMLSFMKWGFHAGTVNDAREARKFQAIGCRLRGTLRRPSKKIIEDVHLYEGKQIGWMKSNDVDLLFSCACCQTKRRAACGYQSVEKYEPR